MAASDWRVEDLARRLCTYHGFNPDELVADARRSAPGPFGTIRINTPQEAWKCYELIATEMLRALDGHGLQGRINRL